MHLVPLALVALTGSIALASQDDAPPSPWQNQPRNSWTLSFEPRIWYAGPSGDIRFPGGTASDDKIDLADLNSDDPRVTPYGELRFQRGRWRIEIAGSAFDADNSSTIATTQTLGSVAVFAGERARLDFAHASFEARALYRFYQYVDGSTADGRDIVQFTIHAGGGLRITHIDLDLAVIPTDPARIGNEITSLSYTHTFAEPIIAASMGLQVYERFDLRVEGTAGYFSTGDSSSASFSIEPTFGWYPVDNLGIEIGYRMLIHRMEDGKDPSQFEWNGSIAGLFAGVSVRF
ncbi:MAG: hypothetical protein KF757_05810 [Phycisphaeraceae bacterium]|nr:hypothetical protein [Phycisphaeraceae bacterium]MCW5763688.1 hypothetical protein [Phycisphaeraceae bacterium]